ncbi:unnamed protein product [Brassica oleracea]
MFCTQYTHSVLHINHVENNLISIFLKVSCTCMNNCVFKQTPYRSDTAEIHLVTISYAWLMLMWVSSVHSEFGSLYDLGLTPSLKYNTISNTSKALLSSKTLFQAPLTQCSNCCYTVLGDVPRAVSSKQAPPCLATTPREVEACSWFREPKHGTAG